MLALLMRRWLLIFILHCGVAAAAPGQTTASAQESGHGDAQADHGDWDQGQLGKQAATLFREWNLQGSALRLRPRMLEQGGSFPLVLPLKTLDPSTDACTTVALLGTPNVSFLLTFEQDELAPSRRAWPVPSAAGVVEVTRCGARKPLLASISVKMRSRRGAIEFIVLESSHPPTAVTEVLPNRNAGPSLPGPQVGKRPWLAPLASRIEARKQRYLSEGADQALVSGAVADVRGRGNFVVHLVEGCHRLDLLAEASSDSPPDLDARLTTVTQGELLESDEEHSGQASLTHCVGRAERFRVEFSGAQGGDEITLLHSQWELPQGIPINWGPVARAELGRAMFERGFPALDEAPSFSAIGVRGTTQLRAEIDSNACYVAAVAPLRGEGQRFALGAQLPRSIREAQNLQAGHGASLQFCAQGSDEVKLETQAVGSGVAWILGLWRLGPSTPLAFTVEREKL